MTLTSLEPQAQKYVEGLPDGLDAPYKPLPFAYLSTGEETVFFNGFDPFPRSRPIFTFHHPDTLREWLAFHEVPGAANGDAPGSQFASTFRPVLGAVRDKDSEDRIRALARPTCPRRAGPLRLAPAGT